VIIPDITCSAQEFQGIVISAFPKLDGCGGLDLLRCIPNTKELEMISLAVSQSPKLLKSVLGCGKVFIWPIQQNLDLDLDKKLTSSVVVCATLRALRVVTLLCVLYTQVKENCIHCKRQILMQSLRNHVQDCRFERLNSFVIDIDRI